MFSTNHVQPTASQQVSTQTQHMAGEACALCQHLGIRYPPTMLSNAFTVNHIVVHHPGLSMIYLTGYASSAAQPHPVMVQGIKSSAPGVITWQVCGVDMMS